MSLRKTIENAAAQKLDLLRQAGRVKAVLFWQGRREPETEDDELIRVLNSRTPAVLITTGDAVPDGNTTGRRTRESIDLLITVVSGILGDQAAGARGNERSSDPGTYALLELARGLLENQPLDVDNAELLRFVSERFIDAQNGIHIWQLTYKMRVARSFDGEADAYRVLQAEIRDATRASASTPDLAVEVTFP